MSDEGKVELPRPAPDERDSANAIGQNAANSAPAQRPSTQELKRILAKHAGWIAKQQDKELPQFDRYLEGYWDGTPFREWRDEALSGPERADLSGADLSRANLSEAYLTGAFLEGANLSGADLFRADLSGANLSRANLSRANLLGANLSRAFLSVANLSGANLYSANLSGAYLTANLSGATMYHANLSDAYLSGANLSGADLEGANLSGANLEGANLTTAKLAGSNVANARYEPSGEPPHPYVAAIKGLSSVRVQGNNVVGLVQLRKLLQDAGLRDLEREATYSIEKAKTIAWRPKVSSILVAISRWLCFDLTTAYGLHPFRALLLIIGIWLLCVPIYCRSIADDPGPLQEASGIYQIFPADRVEGPASEPTIWQRPTVRRVHYANWEAVRAAAYFSLLSAVNIGFEQFTPGDWIQRLQPHEYVLRGEGWVRMVAGAQALLSVFLLAMWALTQFGRPFQ
jgi:hypothetical protein